MAANQKTSSNRFGWWLDYMVDSVGKNIHIETYDGVLRQGRISGFQFRKFTVNDHEVDFPTDLELNGDPNDRVSLERVKKYNIF